MREQGIEEAGGGVAGEGCGRAFSVVMMDARKGSNYTSRAGVAFTPVYHLVSGIVRP
ncbi:hypothetical protein D3C85_1455350 [compost metagenome]